MLGCSQLTKAYNDTRVLSEVSLELRIGEVKVLMGHSGCGKTTLLRCLSLLEPADKGSVVVDDLVVRFPIQVRKLRNIGEGIYPSVAMVFQQLFLWPNLTCRQNLTLVANSPTRIAELSERLQVAKLLDRFPQECSLGQKQRVAFIRAVLARPRYLLCDEITSALDSGAAATVLEILQELGESGTGVLLITHDLDVASALAGTQMLRMENGTLLEEARLDLNTASDVGLAEVQL